MATPVFNQTPNVGNRPIARKDAQGNNIPSSFDDLAYQADYDGGTNLTYKGFARPGASTSAAVWQIAFLQYDGSNNLTSITWPQNSFGNATNDYEFIWTDRASYTYS
jgi:YD repeat-containing protein